MTGFGRATREGPFGQVTVEIKSVNHRFLKTQFRIPMLLESIEGELEEKVRAKIVRGAIQVGVDLKLREPPAPASLDPKVAGANRDRVEALWKALFPNAGPPEPGRVFDALLRLPVAGVSQTPAASDEVTKSTRAALDEALAALDANREAEGSEIVSDLTMHKKEIARLREAVAKIAPESIKTAQARFVDRINQILGEARPGLALDSEALLKESALYADKGDISEELVRLEGHIRRFDEVLSSDAEAGRRLEFLLQEMLREANTIGSKSLDLAISHNVVEIKAEIEKMKEQVQNLE